MVVVGLVVGVVSGDGGGSVAVVAVATAAFFVVAVVSGGEVSSWFYLAQTHPFPLLCRSLKVLPICYLRCSSHAVFSFPVLPVYFFFFFSLFFFVTFPTASRAGHVSRLSFMRLS